MNDYTPSLATARAVFIDGAEGEFVGEDFDRMVQELKAEAWDEGAEMGHRLYAEPMHVIEARNPHREGN